MNTQMNERQIESIWWPDTESEEGRHLVAGEDVLLEFSATHHGDHDEFWVIELREIDGEFKEAQRHNPRYLETIVWAEE